ncbi:MAG: N-acetylmuramoyl-L-alanine amidase [Bacillota bacterium]|jgi:N-acetylmuramoyl-L-alanine amidase
MKRPQIVFFITRPLLLLVLVGLLTVLGVYLTNWVHRMEEPPGPLLPLGGIVIVLDPGHGGIDGGTHDGQGVLEKNIVFDIALELKSILTSLGAGVIMTREADSDLGHRNSLFRSRQRRDLAARTQVAVESQADIFLSIHVNHMKDERKKGSMFFFQRKNPQSNHLAQSLWKQIKIIQPDNEEKPLPAGFYLLRNSPMVTVLWEVGFLSNNEEKNLLINPQYQVKLAQAISLGIIDYIQSSEKSRASRISKKSC